MKKYLKPLFVFCLSAAFFSILLSCSSREISISSDIGTRNTLFSYDQTQVETITVQDNILNTTQNFLSDSPTGQDVLEHLNAFCYEEKSPRQGLSGWDISVSLLLKDDTKVPEIFLYTDSLEMDGVFYRSAVGNAFPTAWRASLLGQPPQDTFDPAAVRTGNSLFSFEATQVSSLEVWDSQYPKTLKKLDQPQLKEFLQRLNAFRSTEKFDAADRQPLWLSVKLTDQDGSTQAFSIGLEGILLEKTLYSGLENDPCFSQVWLEELVYG